MPAAILNRQMDLLPWLGHTVRNSPAMQETRVRSLEPGRSSEEKGMATHPSIFARREVLRSFALPGPCLDALHVSIPLPMFQAAFKDICLARVFENGDGISPSRASRACLLPVQPICICQCGMGEHERLNAEGLIRFWHLPEVSESNPPLM